MVRRLNFKEGVETLKAGSSRIFDTQIRSVGITFYEVRLDSIVPYRGAAKQLRELLSHRQRCEYIRRLLLESSRTVGAYAVLKEFEII
jgi:hypothetical protein